MDYNLIIICISVGWFITEFEPLHFVLNAIKDKLPKGKLTTFVFEPFNCWQCMTFWSALVISQDFVLACTASLASLLINRWIEK